MDFAIKVNEEECRKHYSMVMELNPPSGEPFLPVDESSTFIRNLVKFHANTGASIDLVTKDGVRFRCFVDDEGESDSIVTSEIDNDYLDAFFQDSGNQEDEEARKRVTAAEEKLLEFINNMKKEADEEEGKEDVA